MNRPSLVPILDYQHAGFVRDLADLIEAGALTDELVEGARVRWGAVPAEVPLCLSEARREATLRGHPADA